MTKAFERVIIVMFENQYRRYVMRDPFMRRLAAAGCEMTNYFGAFHPSQTNYLASIAGEVCGVTTDTPPAAPLMQPTLVDLMTPAGAPPKATWKAYMEGYPNEPWNPAWTSPAYPEDQAPRNAHPIKPPAIARYYRKHNPFASFHSIQSDPEKWGRIVDDRAFWQDVEKGALPDYSWFTPDIWNDGHYLYNTHTDTNPREKLVRQLSGWLEYVFLGRLPGAAAQGAAPLEHVGLALDVDQLLVQPEKAYAASRIPPGTLVVITFDEADYDADGYDSNYDGPNQIYTVLLGDMIAPGTTAPGPYNHYSLIRTIEENYGLGSLGKNDRGANWFRFLWKQEFRWSAQQPVGRAASDRLALAALGDAPWMVYGNSEGALFASRLEGDAWSAAVPTGLTASGSIALAAIDDQLVLVYAVGAERDLFTARMSSDGCWTEGTPLGFRTGGDIAMIAYEDCADATAKLMLVWQSPQDDYMKWLSGDAEGWRKTEKSVGQLTDGAIALGQLGASLFLVYKERNTFGMRMCSFNTAPFNAFEAQAFGGGPAPLQNTTLHQWAVQDFPVGHFAKKYAALQNDYQAAGRLALAALSGEMRLVHRGRYKDTPQAYTEIFGLTGIFSAETGFTNGWGTLDQAGWTAEEPLDGVTLDPTGGVALCAAGDRLILAYQRAGGEELYFMTGEYVDAKGCS